MDESTTRHSDPDNQSQRQQNDCAGIKHFLEAFAGKSRQDRLGDDQFSSVEIVDKLKRFELQLFERESRTVAVWYNMIRHFSDKDKKCAVLTAWIHWHFRNLGVAGVLASSGVVGLATLYFLWQSNKFLEQQTALADSARRAAIQQELFSILSDAGKYVDSNTNADDDNAEAVELPKHLQGRSRALLQMARPYRVLDDQGELSDTPLSPERAMLVEGIRNTGASVLFLRSSAPLKYSDYSRLEISDLFRESHPEYNVRGYGSGLESSSFERSTLRDCCFGGMSLTNVSFDDASLKGVSFVKSDLSDTSFKGCGISNCCMFLARLPSAKSFSEARIYGESLYGALVGGESFIAELEASACRIEPRDNRKIGVKKVKQIFGIGEIGAGNHTPVTYSGYEYMVVDPDDHEDSIVRALYHITRYTDDPDEIFHESYDVVFVDDVP